MTKCNTLTKKTINEIATLKGEYEYIFCTNAWNVVFDKLSNEIYGVSNLVDIFKSCNNVALIISDPSNKYKRFLEKKNTQLPNNLIFINYSHDFIDVIKLSDAMIRYTSTDGDSLSIHETLFLRRDVVATSIIERPEGCILFSNRMEIENILNTFCKFKGSYVKYRYRDNIEKILRLYRKLDK